MVVIKVTEAKTPFAKAKGLLGTSRPYPLVLKTRFGIHTFGMKYPIDVVILDNQMRIKKSTQKLCPNRIFMWNPKYFTVVELPVGTIQKKKLHIGTKITLSLLK